MTTKRAAGAAPADSSGGNSGNSLAPAMRDELDGIDFGDNFDDGLGAAARETFQPTIYMINQSGTDKDGRSITKDVFYNTVDETTKSKISAVLCYLQITHRYTRYNNSTKQTDTICRSDDRYEGVMADGTVRKCDGCPDAKWHTEENDEGKQVRRRNCAHVWNVAAHDRDTMQPFLIRFKKTSLNPFKAYLNKHHIKRRIVRGKVLNYPLFAFAVELTAKMAGPKATYALPVLQRTEVLSAEEIRTYEQIAKSFGAQMEALIKKGDDADARAQDADETGDTSFDTNKYVDTTGEDFVPPADNTGKA